MNLKSMNLQPGRICAGAPPAGILVRPPHLSNRCPTENTMPLIHVEMFEGRTPEIKREFVEAITRETCRVLKCAPDAVEIVMRDVKKSDWASGGVLWSERK